MVASCGCSQLDLANKSLPWKKEEVDTAPTRMVPIWSDTTLHESGKPSVRGFGARVYFYSEEAKDPIDTTGTLAVYAFDSDQYDRHHSKPEKKFVFTADQIAKQKSTTQLGPSFSVWLPWGEVGGPARKITLIAKFRTTDGAVIMSEPVRKLLPGTRPVDDATDHEVHANRSEHAGSVQPASYSSESQRPTTTTTIAIPPSFARRLAGDQPNQLIKKPNRLPEAAGEENQPTDANSQSVPEPDQVEQPLKELPSRQRAADHLRQRRLQAQNWRESRRGADPLRRQPHRGSWLSGLPPTPRSPSHPSTPSTDSPVR